MPELPEVRNVVKSLKEYAINKTINDVLIFLPKMIKNASAKEFKELLVGKKIIDIDNRGKFILIKFSGEIFLVNHLRMEGKWHWEEYENSKHDHISLIFNDGKKLIYNDTRQFGTFHIFKENPLLEKPLNNLGDTPWNIDVSTLYEKLKRKRVAIKSALLDQHLIVGLGNIYVNEVLWACKIYPGLVSNILSKKQIQLVVDKSKEIMDKATKLGGTTIDSFTAMNHTTGEYQEYLEVHGHAKKPCSRCHTPIEKMKINGRGTYYCPKCQKRN